jgi:hypothetical protein
MRKAKRWRSGASIRMVRADTSESSIKCIHLKDRKTVGAYNRLRDKGANLSELISNFIIKLEEDEQQRNKHRQPIPTVLSSLANCPIGSNNNQEEVKEQEQDKQQEQLNLEKQQKYHIRNHMPFIQEKYLKIDRQQQKDLQSKLRGEEPDYLEILARPNILQELIYYLKANSAKCYKCREQLGPTEEKEQQYQKGLERLKRIQEWKKEEEEKEKEKDHRNHVGLDDVILLSQTELLEQYRKRSDSCSQCQTEYTKLHAKLEAKSQEEEQQQQEKKAKEGQENDVEEKNTSKAISKDLAS